jgi:hypothetical protein
MRLESKKRASLETQYLVRVNLKDNKMLHLLSWITWSRSGVQVEELQQHQLNLALQPNPVFLNLQTLTFRKHRESKSNQSQSLMKRRSKWKTHYFLEFQPPKRTAIPKMKRNQSQNLQLLKSTSLTSTDQALPNLLNPQ